MVNIIVFLQVGDLLEAYSASSSRHNWVSYTLNVALGQLSHRDSCPGDGSHRVRCRGTPGAPGTTGAIQPHCDRSGALGIRYQSLSCDPV